MATTIVAILTLIFVQLANLICANCEAGVKLVELPKGDIMEETALFNFDGVLLKENARPTFKLVRVANLKAFDKVPPFTSLVSIFN